MFKAIVVILTLALCSSLTVNHEDIGAAASVAGTLIKLSKLFWYPYCVLSDECASRIACGYVENKECVDPFCYGSSDCPSRYYCNDVELYGYDGQAGVCIRNSVYGPILAGGPKVCYGSSQCQRGQYCNDEELWGRDGMRGNCR